MLSQDARRAPVDEPTVTYWNENRRTLNVLARRAAFVRGSAALSRYLTVEPYAGVTVGSNAATELMNRRRVGRAPDVGLT